MIRWVILLQIDPLSALCDPFGASYDKVPSIAVAVGKLQLPRGPPGHENHQKLQLLTITTTKNYDYPLA